MKWFVASLISIIDTGSSDQVEYPVSEDFYLLCAASEDELQRKIAEKIDLQNAAGKGYRLEGRPATLRCLGARKIKSIYNDPPRNIDEAPPADGTELTHSFMSVQSLSDAQMLAAGKTVVVRYIDDDDDELGKSCFSAPK